MLRSFLSLVEKKDKKNRAIQQVLPQEEFQG